MKKNILHYSLLLLMITLLPTFSFAKTVGEVAIVINTAQDLEEKALEWGLLKIKDPVMAESLVRTLNDSKLKLSLIDGSFLLLTENSKTRIDNVDKEGGSIIRMFSGKLRAAVKKIMSPTAKFEVRTPTAIVGVKGTNFVVILRKDITEVIVIDGSVTISNILDDVPGTVEVRANQYTKVTRFSPPSEPVELPMEEIASIVKETGLSNEIFAKELSEAQDTTDTTDTTVTQEQDYSAQGDDPNIEGTTEDPVEAPSDVIIDTDILGGTDINEDVVIEPEYEDTTPTVIQPPPGTPDGQQ